MLATLNNLIEALRIQADDLSDEGGHSGSLMGGGIGTVLLIILIVVIVIIIL